MLNLTAAVLLGAAPLTWDEHTPRWLKMVYLAAATLWLWEAYPGS